VKFPTWIPTLSKKRRLCNTSLEQIRLVRFPQPRTFLQVSTRRKHGFAHLASGSKVRRHRALFSLGLMFVRLGSTPPAATPSVYMSSEQTGGCRMPRSDAPSRPPAPARPHPRPATPARVGEARKSRRIN